MTFTARFLLLVALLATSLNAMAQSRVAPTNDWSLAGAERPAPEAVWLTLMDNDTKADTRGHWLHFLSSLGLTQLDAPVGGRAYRWFWFGTDPSNPSDIQVPHKGYVELVIEASGDALISSTWHPQPINVRGVLPASFETSLAQSPFASLQSQAVATCVDACEDQILESVVDDKYHYVSRDGGIVDEKIRDAVILLEKTARIVGTRRDGNTAADVCTVNGFANDPAMARRPTLLHCAAPAYPEKSRSAGRQGVVMLGAIIRKDGTVTSANVIATSGSDDLDSAGLDAIAHWSFAPALNAQGSPIESRFSGTIEFWKDAVDNIDQKTCADYATDTRWLTSAHPQLSSGPFLYEVLVERFAFEAMRTGEQEEGMKSEGEHLRTALVHVLDKCTANPSANFIATLRAAMASGS